MGAEPGGEGAGDGAVGLVGTRQAEGAKIAGVKIETDPKVVDPTDSTRGRQAQKPAPQDRLR